MNIPITGDAGFTGSVIPGQEDMFPDPRQSSILPACNEEISIGSAILRTHQHADRVLAIDDGSTDRMAEVAELDDLQNRFMIFKDMR